MKELLKVNLNEKGDVFYIDNGMLFEYGINCNKASNMTIEELLLILELVEINKAEELVSLFNNLGARLFLFDVEKRSILKYCDYFLSKNQLDTKEYFINFINIDFIPYVIPCAKLLDYIENTKLNSLFMGSRKFTSKDFLNLLNNYNKDTPKRQKAIIKKITKTYVMYDHSLDLYKIGKSNSPSTRERTLMGQKPTINLVLVCDDNIESDLHLIFKNNRIRGEWFKLSADDLLYLIEHRGFKSQS